MKGFKDFIMRGNLIELAVAFIIGGAFATVVSAFTKMIIEALAKVGGAPNFDDWKVFGLTTFGPFLTALASFLLIARSGSSGEAASTRTLLLTFVGGLTLLAAVAATIVATGTTNLGALLRAKLDTQDRS